MSAVSAVRLVFMAAAVCGAASAHAATLDTLHVFGQGNDGFQLTVGVTMDRAGNLYGTTLNGGARQFGIVWQLVPPASGATAWTENILHTFTNGVDGGAPWSPVWVLPDGSLLGGALEGGTGPGLLWRLVPPEAGATKWTETTVHDFAGPPDGEAPIGGLLASGDGGWYGVTSSGGTGGFGSVYKLSPPAAAGLPWSTTVVYSFTGGDDGRDPMNRLVADAAGRLYGTTQEHGAFGGGAVFCLTPPAVPGGVWTETTLWGFTNGADGGQPRSGLTFLEDGSLVGTTFAGGTLQRGVVYRLAPPAPGQTSWVQTVLHTFTGRSDGANPDGGLTLDARGRLYGTASNGGGTRTYGEVFRLTQGSDGEWTFATVHAFAGGNEGGGPTGDLMLSGGRLYGVTEGDINARNVPPTVYELTP